MTYKKSILSSSIAALAIAQSLGSTVVIAQTGMLEEVIVTARKKSETLQDVPVTVAALTEADLDRCLNDMRGYIVANCSPSIGPKILVPNTGRKIFTNREIYTSHGFGGKVSTVFRAISRACRRCPT